MDFEVILKNKKTYSLTVYKYLNSLIPIGEDVEDFNLILDLAAIYGAVKSRLEFYGVDLVNKVIDIIISDYLLSFGDAYLPDNVDNMLNYLKQEIIHEYDEYIVDVIIEKVEDLFLSKEFMDIVGLWLDKIDYVMHDLGIERKKLYLIILNDIVSSKRGRCIGKITLIYFV